MRIKRFIKAFFIFIILNMLLVSFFHPYLKALVKSRKHFIRSSINHSIYYEEGSSLYAETISSCFPEAVKIIEKKLYVPFPSDFKIYVCSTQKSFNEFIGEGSMYPIRGAVLFGNIYISPGAFDFFGNDTHKETLLHELFHLHFRQVAGSVKERRIPHWFREGLADYISGSGGENLDNREACLSILSGRHIPLLDGNGLLKTMKGARKGLSNQMFHQQSKMIVEFLANKHPVGFKELVKALQQGIPFRKAFEEKLNSSLAVEWESFTQHLKAKGSEIF